MNCPRIEQQPTLQILYLEENRTRLSIIDNFINKLSRESKDLESEIYNFIDANFWDLL
jgi:hypothetical protein